MALAVTLVACTSHDKLGSLSIDVCPPTKVALSVVHDPGHGGSMEKFEISGARTLRTRGFSAEAEDVSSRYSPAARRAFLETLIREHVAYGVLSRESPQFILHPVFYTFTIENECGRRNSAEWVTDAGAAPHDRYGALAEAFKEFFAEAPGRDET